MSESTYVKYDRVFHYFEEISKIPRGSGNTKAISDYLVAFASSMNLYYVKDDSNNVIIYKKASSDCKNKESVILQAHTDMVCEKTKESKHDFFKDGIKILSDDKFIRAKDTTLGADDGIGMSYILAVLESKDIKHPSIEAVFTADEEIGLVGAKQINANHIHSKFLINLDSEKEGVFYVGCAGAMGGTTEIAVSYHKRQGDEWKIELSGLLSGHSGIDIDKNRGNAAILLGHFLFRLKKEIRYSLSAFSSGENNNAIPGSAEASIVIAPGDNERLKQYVDKYLLEIKKEYQGCENSIWLRLTYRKHGNLAVLCREDRDKILKFLFLYPNGVYKKSGYIENVVETSCSLCVTELRQNHFYAFSSIRSSLEESKKLLWGKVVCLSELVGGYTRYISGYPAWEYKAKSKIKNLMVDIYREMYEKNPSIMILHAGLECSLFVQKLPDLECVSIGADIFDIHTTNEHVSIDSVKRAWDYLLLVLERMSIGEME